MKTAMRIPAIVLCMVIVSSVARAAPLTEADRETLLQNLEKIRNTADATIDARFRLAIAAYREGLSSDEAAMALYLKCVEKVNFEDQQKKSQDFREWKRKEADHLNSTGFRLALRYQLRWLILALKASSQNADMTTLAGEARQTIDSLCQDLMKLTAEERTLDQSVISTVFAKAYSISGTDNEKWAMSPAKLDDVYEKIIFPPLRSPAHVESLRAAWIKRIQQEGMEIAAWGGREEPQRSGKNGKNGKSGKRTSMISHETVPHGVGTHTPEYERFQTETLPDLEWQMEVDLYKNGDEKGAAVRMLAHIQKYINHRNARKWTEEFEGLLKPPASPTGAPATAAAAPK